MPDKLYTIPELATLWGLDRNTVGKRLRAGHFPNAIMKGGIWLIPEGDIEKYTGGDHRKREFRSKKYHEHRN